MRVFAFLDRIDPFFAVLIFGTLTIAPIFPEPHLWQKIKALMNGATMPSGMPMQLIDYFDVLLHGGALFLLIMKIARMVAAKKAG